ncbi:putative glycerol kinase 5 [Rhincodon typus]|uniref:putative glycerol kinase 5 n=1 Tax=Rhincodon typus TaxID=259920 RepID=UPI002030C8E3|nr:putative glycerol kinase 5 [Rhincodon typus]
MGSVRNGLRRTDTYVLAVDVGSTSVRCHVYDPAAKIKGSSSRPIKMLYPKPGWVEVNPDEMFEQFVAVVKEAVEDSGLHMKQMAALGISTQRATFVTWDKTTGRPFHNFICWQDLRAVDLVRSWNKSLLLWVVHKSSGLLHFLTRKKRFLAASVIHFSTQHVSIRLAWVLQNIKQVQDAVAEENCSFGTIDTWLLYKLTKETQFILLHLVLSFPGLFSDVAETEKMAQEVQSTDGVFFVPSFSGLQAPLNDPNACASFMGLKPSTTKIHLVRAILESIAYRNKQLYDTMLKEIHIPITCIRADGGICSNQFVMQLTTDLLACDIEKPKRVDMSSLGAAFLAGLANGYWGSREELKTIRSVEKIYKPQDVLHDYKSIIENWELAVSRSMHWYTKTKQE